MSNTNARDNLVSGNIVKTMLSLSIPAILGMVVIGLYNFMDAVFVGKMVGPEAMTAVKVSYPFTLLNSGISTLIGTGSASVLSRAIGKKDRQTVDKIMGNLIAFPAPCTDTASCTQQQRGTTYNPAAEAGIAARVGSLAAGKKALYTILCV